MEENNDPSNDQSHATAETSGASSAGEGGLHRCYNCGTTKFYSTGRLRALFPFCPLCHIELNKLPPHNVHYVPDPVSPPMHAPRCGPGHSLFGQKDKLVLRALAACLGDNDDVEMAVDVTEKLNQLIASQPKPSSIYLKIGFDSSVLFADEQQRVKLLKSLASGEKERKVAVLKIRFELRETDSSPYKGSFRRYATKHKVSLDDWRLLGPAVYVKPPPEPLLRALPTSFLGHVNDRNMQYPVYEYIQTLIDLLDCDGDVLHRMSDGTTRDGSFLKLDPTMDLDQSVGDPHKGAEKLLRLDLDLQGFRK